MKAPSEPAGELDIPPVWHEDKGKGEVPYSDFPGWMEVLHPTWSATSTGEIPLPLSELKQRCCSQSVGGRRAQCERAEECRQAEQEKLVPESSPGSPEPMPKVTPSLGFKGVVAYLLRESPLPALIEATPKVRQPAMLVEPAVTTMYATCIVQDKVTGVTYMDMVTASVGRVALGNPHIMATLPGLLWRNWQKKIWQKATPESLFITDLP